MVVFEPATDEVPVPPATGELGADGSFTMKTPNLGDGAAQGQYRVKIVPDETQLKTGAGGNVVTRDLSKLPFPRRYLDADASKLTATVKPQSNQLEPFRLSKARSVPSSKRAKN
jgi:hypothetical protein